jgi:hypothetical protein
MFGRGAAPLPMFGWWCNLPDCLCGDSPPRLSFERGSKPCSCSEGKVSSPMFGCIGRVSGAIASFRKPPLPCVSGASLPFTSAHASFRIKLTLRFRHQAIALFRKLSLRFGNHRFIRQASDSNAPLEAKPPYFFHSLGVTSNLALAIQISNHDRGQDGPLPSKPAGLKPFVSKSLIPKSFDRGRLRRTFRYNDDSKDVEKRGEGGTSHSLIKSAPPSQGIPEISIFILARNQQPSSAGIQFPGSKQLPARNPSPDGWDGVRCSRSSFIPA